MILRIDCPNISEAVYPNTRSADAFQLVTTPSSVFVMIGSSDFRNARMPLNHGTGHMPVLGFGTLIPDAAVTITATRDALEAGFRHFDCAERYRNEREVGEALQAGLAADGIVQLQRVGAMPTLAQMVARITPENRYAEVSLGAEMGMEIVEW